MLQFYEKRSWRTVVKSPGFLAFLGLLCLLLAVIVFSRFSIERDMAARRVEAETELAELAGRKRVIEEKVEYLSSERGIEAEMRRNFDVAQPGEQVVIILDKDADTSAIQPLPPPAPDTPRWYEFWR